METLLLYYLSSLAGLVMVTGGIWLLYKQKIYIDQETKQVTEIEFPIGKFKTNAPALMLFALGFVPLIYPIHVICDLRQLIQARGTVSTDSPVDLYVVVAAKRVYQSGQFTLPVPRLEAQAGNTQLLYVAGERIRTMDLSILAGGEIQLEPIEFTLSKDRRFIPAPNVHEELPHEFRERSQG